MKKPASRRHGKRVSEASSNQQSDWELLNTANARLLASALTNHPGGLFGIPTAIFELPRHRAVDYLPGNVTKH